jgi:hypothetical protein
MQPEGEAFMPEVPHEPLSTSDEDRREFLKNCGRFAVVTPPAVTMLLSTSLTSNAIAKSGGGGGGKVKGNNGWGNGADPRNPGSSHGKGVARGGRGAGQSQESSKTGRGR